MTKAMFAGIIIFGAGLFLSEELFAGRVSALVGPPSLGQGGSNPVSVPPINILDWQFSYVTDQDREYVFSVIPGIFYGQRWRKEQFHISLGGGLLISTSGAGLGFSQSFGWESIPLFQIWRFEAEYRQVVGVTASGAEFPYAIRIGVNCEI